MKSIAPDAELNSESRRERVLGRSPRQLRKKRRVEHRNMRNPFPTGRSRSLYPPQSRGIVQRSQFGELSNVTDHRIID